jgi:hypothetical protein
MSGWGKADSGEAESLSRRVALACGFGSAPVPSEHNYPLVAALLPK